MCDYRQVSKTAVQQLPVPVERTHRILGRRACAPLVRLAVSGRLRQGCDLVDGKRLPAEELARGHYMSVANFQASLRRMANDFRRCQWCHQPLPAELVARHQQQHDHREQIDHHFHPQCWRARLLAVGAVFGNLDQRRLTALQGRHRRRRSPDVLGYEPVAMLVRKVRAVRYLPR